MKSLKRTLCLVLALVMVLGLFGIASATNFTDDNTIQYKEAVEVVTGIGAIKGMGDGTFAPKGTITRAQAATMVARVALTAGVADSLTGVTSNFTDVTVEGGFGWAIPSIEYLTGKGIINGMGDGTFNPNGEISGYAVLKMLLCVLGYGAKDEYVGTGWDLQVAIDAAKPSIGLTKDRVSTTALSAPATREEVALYCFNALNVDIVDYDIRLNAYSAANHDTLGEEVYGLKAVAEGIVTSNGAISTTAAKNGTTTLATGANFATSTVFAANTGLDLIGHYVKVYYRDATAAEKAAAGNTISATGGKAYAVVDVSTVVNVEKAITTSATGWKAAFGSTDVGVHANVIKFTANTYAVGATIGVVGSTTFTAPVGTYVVYDNQIVSAIQPATYAPDVVASITPATTSAGVTIAFEKDTTNSIYGPAPNAASQVPVFGASASATAPCSYYSDIAKGDIVTIAQTGDFYTVAKAKSATGTVTAFNAVSATNPKANIVAGGTTYTKSDDFMATSTTLGTAAKDFTNALVNGEYNIFVGPDGKVIALTEIAGAAPSLVYLVSTYSETTTGSYGTSTTIYKAQCVDLQGKEVTYVVGTTNTSATAGQLATVTTTYNDTLKTDVATLTTLVDNTPTTLKYVNNGSTTPAIPATAPVIEAGSYYAADTVFLFVTGEKATLKASAAVGPQTIPAGANFVYSADKVGATTNYTVKVVVVKAQPTVAPTSGVMFVPSPFNTKSEVSYTKADGKPGVAYKNIAFVDGQPNTSVLTTSVVGIDSGFYTFAVDAQGIYTLTPYTGKYDVGAVSNVYNNLLTTTGGAHDLTNADASGAFIVDVPYLQATLTGTQGVTQHTTLASILAETNKTIAFTYSEDAAGTKTVTGIYYIGAAPAAKIAVAGTVTNFTITASSTPVSAGTTVTVTITPETNASANAEKTITIAVTDGETYTVKFSVAEQKADTPVAKTVDIVVAGAVTIS